MNVQADEMALLEKRGDEQEELLEGLKATIEGFEEEVATARFLTEVAKVAIEFNQLFLFWFLSHAQGINLAGRRKIVEQTLVESGTSVASRFELVSGQVLEKINEFTLVPEERTLIIGRLLEIIVTNFTHHSEAGMTSLLIPPRRRLFLQEIGAIKLDEE